MSISAPKVNQTIRWRGCGVCPYRIAGIWGIKAYDTRILLLNTNRDGGDDFPSCLAKLHVYPGSWAHLLTRRADCIVRSA